jgi:Protein of unknown function (DUF2793)
MSVTNGPRRGQMINALTGDGFDANFRQLLRAIDALLMCNVLNKTLTAPPGSPANGDAHIVATGGTGAWAGHDNAIAVWTTDNPSAPSGEWEFYPAANGILVYNVADTTIYFWNGSAWTAVAGGSGMSNPMTTLGDLIVGGAAGAPARLAIGVTGQVPTVVSGAVAWATPAGGGGGAPTAIAGVNNQTANYVLVLGDAGFLVRMNLAGANTCTIPPNSSVAFPVDTVVTIRQVGAGITTIVAGAGVTINSPSTLAIARQNGTVQLVQVATDTWDLMGDVT